MNKADVIFAILFLIGGGLLVAVTGQPIMFVFGVIAALLSIPMK